MASYDERWPTVPAADGYGTAARDVMSDAVGTARPLLPLPGVEMLSSLPLLFRAATGETGGPVASSGDIPAAVQQQAASIVTQAASVLDEEMARGVLAARRSAMPGTAASADASNPVLRQLHDLVDNVAAMWSKAPAGAWQAPLVPGRPVAADEPVSELKTRAAVTRGQRASISMTLANHEARPVRLVATVTDLLGSRGGRIASSAIELSPVECSLEPRQQRELVISVVVPAETPTGCYSGLLVVTGIDYLRAIIMIDVV